MKLEVDGLIESLMEMDCGDSVCWFAQDRSGVRTNGGCRCLSDLPQRVRHNIVLLWQAYWREVNSTE